MLQVYKKAIFFCGDPYRLCKYDKHTGAFGYHDGHVPPNYICAHNRPVSLGKDP